MKRQGFNKSRILLFFVLFLTQSTYGVAKNEHFDTGAVKLSKDAAAAQPVEKEWTVLVFVEGRNNLHMFARRNIQEMAMIGSNERVNVLVQWYQPRQPTWRYRIEKKMIVPEECVESSQDIAHDLVESMRWAVTKYPAKHYSVILWNHGLGIHDPVWNVAQSSWSIGTAQTMGQSFARAHQEEIPALDFANPRTQIAGISIPLKTIHQQHQHRGILFNEIDRTYMNNQDMVRAFNEIKNTVLNGKKIDVVGMDACLMSMVEIGYQIRNCADYIVTSEEVELAWGWAYRDLFSILSQQTLSSKEFAEVIVATYERYYKGRTELYTQSAVDLSRIALVKHHIDQVVTSLRNCRHYNNDLVRTIIARACRRCQQFSTPTFIDLHSFYTEMHRQLQFQERSGSEHSRPGRQLRPAIQVSKIAARERWYKRRKNTQPGP